ncbi:Ribosomal silencing factor RsfS [Legionella quinlivanii]|uniref:Ribosomal silencing factor RsfS n=1 Tax=Legionella quinlivanii TaxID=45073 RepID=A0A0W0Y3N6_9GAMM|nr:ribosome silencing factor [Legionella quinlivanii]KTD51513.1 Ribosomal silencing factor RsfS [Legionella quinlivanii]MCW8450850.1 ribosome silencing factor [Legionella quinlivanii]SEF57505.1 ribosome-associated protein [Legionella quinlivanii DSM 21216]STY10961.1 putative Iojap-related protein [Legionella quinlivanii]
MSEYSTQLNQLLVYLDDIHANDIKVLDVKEQTTITDYMIIASGRSSRHVKSIADFVMEKMKADGYPALSENGIEHGDWALVDFGDYVLHVMQPDSRAFYNLEALWEK